MSLWYEVADDDIDIDAEHKEINFLVFSDNQGNTYATITFKQLEELNKKMKDGNHVV